MNEIERWASSSGGGLLPSRGERQKNSAIARLRDETQFAGMQLDAGAALAGKAMERARDLHLHAEQQAGDDPVLLGVLRELEIGYVLYAQQVQRRFGAGGAM